MEVCYSILRVTKIGAKLINDHAKTVQLPRSMSGKATTLSVPPNCLSALISAIFLRTQRQLHIAPPQTRISVLIKFTWQKLRNKLAELGSAGGHAAETAKAWDTPALAGQQQDLTLSFPSPASPSSAILTDTASALLLSF